MFWIFFVIFAELRIFMAPFLQKDAYSSTEEGKFLPCVSGTRRVEMTMSTRAAATTPTITGFGILSNTDATTTETEIQLDLNQRDFSIFDYFDLNQVNKFLIKTDFLLMEIKIEKYWLPDLSVAKYFVANNTPSNTRLVSNLIQNSPIHVFEQITI